MPLLYQMRACEFTPNQWLLSAVNTFTKIIIIFKWGFPAVVKKANKVGLKIMLENFTFVFFL